MSLSTSGASGIDQLINVNQPSTAATSSGTDLGANTFLQLLTTELQNQDPTQPQDPTESVTQLAQFSELQYQQQLTSAFQNFQTNFGVLQSASLIGKQVTASTGTSSSGSSSSSVTGTVSSIDVEDGSPYFTMTNSSGGTITDSNGNPLLFPTTSIIGVGAVTSTTPSTTGSAAPTTTSSMKPKTGGIGI